MTFRWFFSIAFCVLLVGCDALVTTNPLVKHGEAHILDGRYVLMLKDSETPIHLTIAYDKTNSVYQIDAGKEGTFQALLPPTNAPPFVHSGRRYGRILAFKG